MGPGEDKQVRLFCLDAYARNERCTRTGNGQPFQWTAPSFCKGLDALLKLDAREGEQLSAGSRRPL